MPLSTETIKNSPLNGLELAEVIAANVKEVLANDCFFSRNIAYTRCSFSFTITAHGAGLTQPVVVNSRYRPDGALEATLPLADADPEDSQFVALERKVTVESPNLERIHHGMPIRVQSKNPPTPGDPFPSFVEHEIRYEPGEHEPLPKPVDEDITEKEMKRLRVAAKTRQHFYDKAGK